MTFKKSNLEDVDLGETNLENLFINSYMQHANEVQLKVYILGLYFSDIKNKSNDVYTIAEKLNIKPIKVIEAFKYWRSKGLVNIIETRSSEYDIDYKIEYVGAKNLYIRSLLDIDDIDNSKTSSILTPKNKQNNSELDVIQDRECIQFFNELELLISSPITQRERMKIAKLISTYGTSYEMIREAYNITYNEKNITDRNSINYIESVIKNWSRENINSKQEMIDNYNLKKELIKSLGISANLIKTEAISKFLCTWREKLESDNLLIAIANYSAKKSNTPSISRLENLLNDISKNYPLTSAGFNEYINRNKNNKTKNDKHRFNNDYKSPNKSETDFLLERSKIMARRENE